MRAVLIKELSRHILPAFYFARARHAYSAATPCSTSAAFMLSRAAYRCLQCPLRVRICTTIPTRNSTHESHRTISAYYRSPQCYNYLRLKTRRNRYHGHPRCIGPAALPHAVAFTHCHAAALIQFHSRTSHFRYSASRFTRIHCRLK